MASLVSSVLPSPISPVFSLAVDSFSCGASLGTLLEVPSFLGSDFRSLREGGVVQALPPKRWSALRPAFSHAGHLGLAVQFLALCPGLPQLKHNSADPFPLGHSLAMCPLAMHLKQIADLLLRASTRAEIQPTRSLPLSASFFAASAGHWAQTVCESP